MRVFSCIRSIAGILTYSLASTPNKTNNTKSFALASGSRVAVAFRGHYIRNSTGHYADTCSNFFNTAANIEESLFKPLRERGMKVSVFLHTMSDSACPENDKRLVSYLQPVLFKFEERLPYAAYSYEEVLKLVLSRRSEIDVLMLVRFDVVYRDPVTALDVQWDKLNVAFNDLNPGKVSDLFFVFPIGFLPGFLDALAVAPFRRFTAHWVLKPLLNGSFVGEDIMHGTYPVHVIDPSERGTSTLSRQHFKNGLRANFTVGFFRFLSIDRSCSGVEQCIAKGAASQLKCSSFKTSGTCPSSGCDWRNSVCQTCNWQCYLDRYVDLQGEFGATNTPASRTHWQAFGWREGRDCTCSG